MYTMYNNIRKSVMRKKYLKYIFNVKISIDNKSTGRAVPLQWSAWCLILFIYIIFGYLIPYA